MMVIKARRLKSSSSSHHNCITLFGMIDHMFRGLDVVTCNTPLAYLRLEVDNNRGYTPLFSMTVYVSKKLQLMLVTETTILKTASSHAVWGCSRPVLRQN